MSEKTIFSKILAEEISCDEVYQDDVCMAFRDVQPQAPVHILVIPKKLIPSMKETNEDDKELLGHLLLTSAKIANQEKLRDWRTVINTGAEAGQTVFHLHIHIIGGRKLKWPPG